MAVVRVRILAVNDGSVKSTILDYVSAVQKADKAIERSARETATRKTRTIQGGYRQSAHEEEKLTATVAREEQKRTRERERSLKYVAKVKDRFFADQQKQEEKAGRETALRGQRVFRETVSSVSKLGRQAIGLMGDALTGAGVDFGLGSNIRKNIDIDKVTRKVANVSAQSQNRAVTDADNQRVGALIRGTGDSGKIEYGEIASGLDEFVKVSSDLGTAEKVFASIADITQATGGDFTLLAKMAGEFNSKLSEGPDKAANLLKLVNSFAIMSSRGAIELEDTAQYANILAGAAGKIEGSEIDNLLQMGALAQMSRAENKGTPAEASRSAASLIRDVTKKANLERLTEAGIDVYGNKEHTTLKSPEKLITSILEKTKGDIGALSELLPNEMSRAAVEALSKTYLREGSKGIHERFASYTKAADPNILKASAANAKAGDAAKIAETNNKLADAFLRLLPAVEAMLPAITTAADFLSNHLGTAIMLAIVGSLAKAAIGEAIKNAIFGGSGGGGGVGGAGGKAVPAIAAGVTAFAATTELLNAAEKAGETRANNASSLSAQTNTSMVDVEQGKMTSFPKLLQNIADMEAAFYNPKDTDSIDNRQAWQAQMNDAKALRNRVIEQNADLLPGWARPQSDAASPARSDGDTSLRAPDAATAFAAQVQEGNAQFLAGLAQVQAALGGTLSVNVVNMPAGGSPFSGPNQNGTTRQ
jgi:hypothetical protein